MAPPAKILDASALDCEISVIRDVAARLGVQLAAIEKAVARLGSVIDHPDARRIWAMAVHLARAVADYLQWIDRVLFGDIAMDTAVGRPWTCVDVTLEGGPDPEIAGHSTTSSPDGCLSGRFSGPA